MRGTDDWIQRPAGSLRKAAMSTRAMAVKIRAHRRGQRSISVRGLGDFINLTGLLLQGLTYMLTYECLLAAMLTVGSIFLVSRQMLNITFRVEFAIFSAGCIFPLTFNVKAGKPAHARADPTSAAALGPDGTEGETDSLAC